MIRFTWDGLPIIDPAWQQDEQADRGEPEEPVEEGEDDDEDDAPDAHLEAAFEDRVGGDGNEDDPQAWSDAPW